jgi:hypothetical protein
MQYLHSRKVKVMITSAATAKLIIVLLLGQSGSGSIVVDEGRSVDEVGSAALETVEKSSVVDSIGVVAVIVVDALSSASRKFVTT